MNIDIILININIEEVMMDLMIFFLKVNNLIIDLYHRSEVEIMGMTGEGEKVMINNLIL